MKILDIVGFDQLPAGNNTVVGVQLQPTRLRMVSASNTSSVAAKVAASGRLLVQAYWGSTSAYPEATVSQYLGDLSEAPSQPDSIITHGLRAYYGGTAGGDVSPTTMSCVWLSIANSARVQVIEYADFESKVVDTSHYFEISVNRATGIVTVYRDNKLYKQLSIATQLAGGEYLGILFGVRGRAGGYQANGTHYMRYRDLYVAEFLPEDQQVRLGPQTVVALPPLAVEADTWANSSATLSKTAVLNEVPANWTDTVAMQHLVVNDTDPSGLVTLSLAGIAPDARVSGVVVGVNALGVSGASKLVTEVVDTGVVVATSEEDFSQTYSRDSSNALSNYGRQIFTATMQNSQPGNKAVLEGYKFHFIASDAL